MPLSRLAASIVPLPNATVAQSDPAANGRNQGRRSPEPKTRDYSDPPPSGPNVFAQAFADLKIGKGKGKGKGSEGKKG